MVEKADSERLQPSLLDRLTDNAREKTQETRDQRVIDIRRLREIIVRDLSWLLNTTNLESSIEFDSAPLARASTVNFGVGAFAGGRGGARNLQRIQRQIRFAIEKFEPRILPGTLEINMQDTEGRGSLLTFDIRGELWAQPVPLELYMRTEIDVSTGEMRVQR